MECSGKALASFPMRRDLGFFLVFVVMATAVFGAIFGCRLGIFGGFLVVLSKYRGANGGG